METYGYDKIIKIARLEADQYIIVDLAKKPSQANRINYLNELYK